MKEFEKINNIILTCDRYGGDPEDSALFYRNKATFYLAETPRIQVNFR